MTVIQLQPYLDMDEWIEATDGMVASIDPKEWSDGEMNWLMAIAHLRYLARTRGTMLRAFLQVAQENICCAIAVGKMTVQEQLLMTHLSAGVAIAQKLYPAMDWCSEIEANEFGREGN